MRTGSSSLNFFQVVFTRVVTAISQPPPAESLYMKQILKCGLLVDIILAHRIRISEILPWDRK